MVRGIVVTHGNLASELIATAKSIFGDFEGCEPISNSCVAPSVLVDRITAIVESGGPSDRYVVFTDFSGGSCSHACLGVEAAHPEVVVVSGVNLPMILAFLNKRTEVPFESLADVVVERGRASIHTMEVEDF